MVSNAFVWCNKWYMITRIEVGTAYNYAFIQYKYVVLLQNAWETDKWISEMSKIKLVTHSENHVENRGT